MPGPHPFPGTPDPCSKPPTRWCWCHQPGEDETLRRQSVQDTLAADFPHLQQVALTVQSRAQGTASGDGILPFDRHLAGGGALQLSRLGSRTRIAATEAAGRALLAANRA